jgi:hypothetical protein
VVILTNLEDHRQEARTRQLADHGLNIRVFTNQGPKGPAIRAILNEYRPSRAVFIDDIAQHHGSAFEVTPDVSRLHLCGEPLLAPIFNAPLSRAMPMPVSMIGPVHCPG